MARCYKTNFPSPTCSCACSFLPVSVSVPFFLCQFHSCHTLINVYDNCTALSNDADNRQHDVTKPHKNRHRPDRPSRGKPLILLSALCAVLRARAVGKKWLSKKIRNGSSVTLCNSHTTLPLSRTTNHKRCRHTLDVVRLPRPKHRCETHHLLTRPHVSRCIWNTVAPNIRASKCAITFAGRESPSDRAMQEACTVNPWLVLDEQDSWRNGWLCCTKRY